MRSIGDKVSLSSARGGWQGYIIDLQGSNDSFRYFITPQDQNDPYNHAQWIDEADIQPGSLAKPTFSIGQTITLYGRSGTISAINGDQHSVDIHIPRKHHTLNRVPFLLVIGDREVEEGTVAVRTREGENLGSMTLEDLAGHLGGEVAKLGNTGN